MPGSNGGVNGSVEPIKMRDFAEQVLYPRMHSNQLLLIVPGTFACSNLTYMPLEDSDRSVAEKMEG